MANDTVTISWKSPAVGPRQRPLKQTLVEYRVKANPPMPWTKQDTVPADQPQKLPFTQVAPGTYEYQVTPFDIADVPGSARTVEASVGFDAPGPVTDLAAAVE